MRHHKNNVRLNRTAAHRRALMANLAGALFTHKKIKTTLPKARATRSYAERLITFARKGDLAARRQVLRKITDKTVVKELFDTIGPKFRERNGGYTRIIRLDNRPGDNAPMAILELVGFAADDTGTKKTKKAAGKRKDDSASKDKTVIKKTVKAVEKKVEAAQVGQKEAPTEEAARPETETAKPAAETEAAAKPEPTVEKKAGDEKKSDDAVETAPQEDSAEDESATPETGGDEGEKKDGEEKK